MGVDPDFLLIQKMRLGEAQALEEFVKKYYPRILKYCRAHVRDVCDAEDLTQETFIHFFRTLKQYRHYGKAVNYLYVIAANVCRDDYRKKKEIPMGELPERPDQSAERLEERLTVRMALEQLPDDLKETAVLYFLQECKQKDIARILGISLPLVKYRIRRARKQLSAFFGEEER